MVGEKSSWRLKLAPIREFWLVLPVDHPLKSYVGYDKYAGIVDRPLATVAGKTCYIAIILVTRPALNPSPISKDSEEAKCVE